MKTERALFSDKEGVKIIAVAIWQTGRRRLEKKWDCLENHISFCLAYKNY